MQFCLREKETISVVRIRKQIPASIVSKRHPQEIAADKYEFSSKTFQICLWLYIKEIPSHHCLWGHHPLTPFTLPETNIALENQWLEDVFPIERVLFLGDEFVRFRGCNSCFEMVFVAVESESPPPHVVHSTDVDASSSYSKDHSPTFVSSQRCFNCGGLLGLRSRWKRGWHVKREHDFYGKKGWVCSPIDLSTKKWISNIWANFYNS